MDVAAWLRGLGLEQYARAFRDNDVDGEVLPELTADDLISIGVTSVGHRRKLLAAIAALRTEPPTAAPAASATSAPISPPTIDAERRQLTVMFGDLVGSTELSARLDPEDLRAVIGAYHRCCAGVIERNGGFVAKYMGDGVLAYFGYPRADEHDAERAVRAGLELVEAVAALDTPADAPVQVRVGIATGLVVVGDLIGEGAAQEQSVVGETPNLAARLQALAEPRTVVIGPSTRRLTAGLFDYEDLGTVKIKGFAAPVTASRVLRESAVEGRFEAHHGPELTPLVGRDEELDLLLRRWQQAKTGEGCVVLVSGEPGIGKSRLAQTLLERLSGEPHTRLRFFCSPHHQDSALYPTITQLERAAGFRREDTAEQRLDKLEAVLAQATNDLGEAAPLLAALLSLPVGDRHPPLNLTPQKQRERTLQALVAQVQGLAARQPVVMLFEDAQWSDPTSLELFDLIIDRAPALPLLLIITFRPEFSPPWTGRPHVTSSTLNRLTPRQRTEMIAGVTGGKALPEEIAAQIIDRTDGVPLFVEELTKAVVESGILTDTGNRFNAAGPVVPLAIPASLQASLLARLDRLAPAREVAQIGAALGRQFSHELLSAVAPMPPAQLDEALGQLVASELVYRRGTPPDAEYTFKHALVQDAAYSTLLRGRRQHLHTRIAVALEERFPGTVESQPELLAHHCTEAGLSARAVRYWQRAGERATQRSAHVEAIAHLTKGLETLKTLPETPEHTQQALTLYTALGAALMIAKGLGAPEVEHAYIQAHALCQQVGETPLSRSCLVCTGFITDGYSCTERGRSAKPCCAWRNVPKTPRSRSSPTMPSGRRGSSLARCRPPACTWRKPSHATRQTSTGRRCSAWARIRVWAAESMPHCSSGYLGIRSKPWPASTRPWRWRTSCRILIVWRMRGVGRPTSISFAGTCQPCTSRQRPPSRSRSSRAFHSGRPRERSCAGGRWPCRARARQGWPRYARGSPPTEPLRHLCSSHTIAHCWRKSLPTWATRKTAFRRWSRPTP